MRKAFAPFLLLFFIAVGTSACGSLGLPSPETTAEKIVSAESTFTFAVRTATEAKKAGLISVALEEALDLAIDGGNLALKAAKEQYALGAPENAEDWLVRALAYAGDINALVQRARST